MDEDNKLNELGEQQEGNSTVNGKQTNQNKNKRRKKAEIAAEKLAREKQLNSDAEAAKTNIANYKKQMAELQKLIDEEENKRKSNRNAVRTHKAMQLYGDLIAILGFDAEEKACATEADFDDLAVKVKDKVKVLLNSKK